MRSFEIVFASLSIAFCWVEFINPIGFKPFNCIKCMTGWISFTIAVLSFTYESKCLYLPNHYPIVGYLYGLEMLAIGVFVGAMFEGAKMRWL